MIILSHFQIEPVLQARQAGELSVATSLDLGLTSVELPIDADGLHLPDGQRLTWALVTEIQESKNNCFRIEDEDLVSILLFSEEFGRQYSLMPTITAPTMLVSGIPMHRIKDADPLLDTHNKVRTVTPIYGHLLDTATGLGYTAIQAAKKAEQVTTVELDPAAQEIARQNPWSQALFTDPKIEQRIGDSYDLIQEMDDGIFERILHDPPTFSLAGELYSLAFYRESAPCVGTQGTHVSLYWQPKEQIRCRRYQGGCTTTERGWLSPSCARCSGIWGGRVSIGKHAHSWGSTAIWMSANITIHRCNGIIPN